jgi:hypothetical protein
VDNDSLSNHDFSSPPNMMEMGRKCLGVKSAYLHHHLFMCAKLNFTRLDNGTYWGGFLNFVPYGLWVLQVNGKNFSWYQHTWHWSMIVISILLTLACVIASFRNIISAASGYHVFHSNNWFLYSNSWMGGFGQIFN